jgi:hypothetical protein
MKRLKQAIPLIAINRDDWGTRLWAERLVY